MTTKTSHFRFVTVMMICCGIGLFGGWFAASQTASSSHHDTHGTDGAETSTDTHDGHSADESSASIISPQAQATMGIKTKEAELTTFWKSTAVAAKAVSTAQSEFSMTAYVGGKVDAILVQRGQAVVAGQPVMQLLRDPFPLPELSRVGGLLSQDRVKVLLQYLVEGKDMTPLLKVLSLDPKLAKTLASLNTTQAQALLYRKMLKRAGLWSKTVEGLYATMSPVQQGDPMSIAAWGELSAMGVLTPDFLRVFKRFPDAVNHSKVLLSLVQSGADGQYMRTLIQAGYLQSRVIIRSPNPPLSTHESDASLAVKTNLTIPGTPSMLNTMDVMTISVKPGDRFDAGQSLVTLSDYSRLRLVAKPVGHELAAMRSALSHGQRASATPMIDGAGPILSGLELLGMTSEEDGHVVAQLNINNTLRHISKSESGRPFRTWDIQPGTAYRLHIPTDKMTDVFVVPAQAVVRQGTDDIVYLKSGNAFEPAKVAVRYQDDRYAVLSDSSEIFEGDPVVTDGAFSLDLAIKAASGQGVDPHAGHNH